MHLQSNNQCVWALGHCIGRAHIALSPIRSTQRGMGQFARPWGILKPILITYMAIALNAFKVLSAEETREREWERMMCEWEGKRDQQHTFVARERNKKM